MATKERRTEKRTYSVQTAATKVKLSAATVRTYCTRGLIGTRHELPGSGMIYYTLDDADLEWLRNEENRPKGRPPKPE